LQNKKVLFVTWDGPQVNYLETLFIPIFKGLQDQYGYEFHIIQFIWGGEELIPARKKKFLDIGIPYQGISISHHYPMLSLLKAAILDTFKIKKYIRQHGIEVLMPRATTSIGIVHRLIKKLGIKLVFDADGFSQDERVDFSGLSPLSLRYRMYRDLEFKGYHLSHSIICRSSKAKEIIVDRSGAGFDPKKVFVVQNGTYIPTATEKSHVKKEVNCRLVYLGSIGPQYMLHDIFEIYGHIKNRIPYAQLTILTKQVHQVSEILKQKFSNLEKEVNIKTVSADEVASELRNYDIGISLRVESFSMQGVAPIKVSDYLGAGLSVIYSPGIGDMDQLMKGKSFAFRFNGESLEALSRLDTWVQEQMEVDQRKEVLEFAKEVFGLNHMVKIYHEALQYG
jgi:hypothetical protein